MTTAIIHKKNSKSFNYKRRNDFLHAFDIKNGYHFSDGNEVRSEEWNNNNEGEWPKPEDLQSNGHDYPKMEWTVRMFVPIPVWPGCCKIDFISIHSETQSQADVKENETEHSHNFEEVFVIAEEFAEERQII